MRTVTANYTVVPTDQAVFCAPTSATTLTLPSASANTGRVITFTKSTSSTYTCTVSGIATVYGTNGKFVLSNPSLTDGSNTMNFLSDGVNWFRMA